MSALSPGAKARATPSRGQAPGRRHQAGAA